MKIFYDGNAIKKYKSLSFIEGFTTNTSFTSQSEYKDYKDYIKDYVNESDQKPCSFQVWSDEDAEIERQAREIINFGHNIYVKVPIIKTSGEPNITVIKKLISQDMKINITAVHTKDQINSVMQLLPFLSPVIVSVFAGGITDSGRDPKEIIAYAVNKYKTYSNIEVLWAGCQTNLNIVEARECGCQIITIPDAIINKMDRMKHDLLITSINKVKKFMEDAEKIQVKF